MATLEPRKRSWLSVLVWVTASLTFYTYLWAKHELTYTGKPKG